jgi:hypothetical protein
MDMKNFKKVWLNSLSFLDNSIIHAIIVVILVLYSSTIFDNINSFVGNLYNFSIIKLIVLLLVVYVSPKDTSIAVLLAISYMVSLTYMVNNENFISSHAAARSSSSHSTKKKKNKEHFFPLIGSNAPDTANFDTMPKKHQEQEKHLTDPSSCLQNYTPEFESVGDVCAPTATFKNEFNAQGLNYPEGFNLPVVGSPLE